MGRGGWAAFADSRLRHGIHAFPCLGIGTSSPTDGDLSGEAPEASHPASRGKANNRFEGIFGISLDFLLHGKVAFS